jgi:hypothetical protein
VEGPGGGGGPFHIDPIPPCAAHFNAAKPYILTVPPYSVSGAVIY